MNGNGPRRGGGGGLNGGQPGAGIMKPCVWIPNGSGGGELWRRRRERLGRESNRCGVFETKGLCFPFVAPWTLF